MRSITNTKKRKGFALIVTLSLMILLTVIAVGLLSLASITLRTSAQGDNMAKAKSNARLALMFAIGDLQKMAGPDTRITAPANLSNPNTPAGITGVWKSWRPPAESPDYAAAKTGDNFLGYLMSNPDPTLAPDPKALPGGTAKVQQLVGPATVGTNNSTAEIGAPLVNVRGTGAKLGGSFAYVALDEGVKSRIDLEPADTAVGVGEEITQVGSPARNGFDSIKDMEFLVAHTPPEKNALREVLPKLVTYKQVALGSAQDAAMKTYFHDFNVDSTSVQANVATGGLKTDLSVLFDGNTLPPEYTNRRLYSDTTQALGGVSSAPDPLWPLYYEYSRLYKRTTANNNPTDGLQASVPRGYRLFPITNPAPAPSPRFEPYMASVREPMIVPTISRVDIVFSLITRDAHGDANRLNGLKAKQLSKMLHMMYLPIITLHNPYNVPLRFTELEVEFADLPMGFQFMVGGQPVTTGMVGFNQLYSNNQNGTNPKIFKMVLTGDLTTTKEVVMGPGETRIFGKPFPADWKWANEEAGGAADGKTMFDWRNDKTGASPHMMPGMITGPNDGVGYDVDWLSPAPVRAEWIKARTPEGIVPVKDNELISVLYGPRSQASTTSNKFSVSLRLKSGSTKTDVATTQVFFKDDARLKSILEEGTSLRFKTPRSFPETYPKTPLDGPKSVMSLYESNNTPISAYANARPFAIFTLSGKTTRESFTPSRPVADTGLDFQMATCDFTTSSSQGASPLEFMLVPLRGGNGGIDSDGVKGYFFGGFGTTNGTTSAVTYEIPTAPLQSIAQLRHANGSNLGSVPYVTYSVGESRAHPAVPANKSYFNPSSGKTYYDHSWLANDRLWDQYWFSTLASLEGKGYTGPSAMTRDDLASAFVKGSRDLPNSRNTAFLPPGKTEKDFLKTMKDSVDGKASAAYMMTTGGFNVNSTSVAAWTSMLSGLCDTDVPLLTGPAEVVSPDAPFLRIRRPILGHGPGSPAEKLWNSYRTLKPEEIKTLAERIVDEVRLRGPFQSMSEFVNRRLGAPGGLTNAGAIQAALDQSTLNAPMNVNSNPIAPGDVGAFGWENPAAVTGTTGAGAPGEISQGDVLSAIGSFVTVRSDTFKIRAYGDAKDASGKVLARAWCEAVVQRIPSYVDSTDAPEAVATAPANIAFGRQFHVISFRWLNPGEV